MESLETFFLAESFRSEDLALKIFWVAVAIYQYPPTLGPFWMVSGDGEGETLFVFLNAPECPGPRPPWSPVPGPRGPNPKVPEMRGQRFGYAQFIKAWTRLQQWNAVLVLQSRQPGLLRQITFARSHGQQRQPSLH